MAAAASSRTCSTNTMHEDRFTEEIPHHYIIFLSSSSRLLGSTYTFHRKNAENCA
ncbi:hypothetical protein NC652_031859 [Populus alba x Populus x berolinensis]|uniref:Uncharacterized protein n=1 Tax=Populus alba x Populus x berolinensis TaxID=444605 RepID=A0AAD6Q3R6_9ROSI|nr:hypothetical protein NC652_031859 [Populus alba x Populus x berolinensis]KAJ6975923.1 hypothetical protein NC653_031676 [Populus alba x Populus x berolinensis]